MPRIKQRNFGHTYTEIQHTQRNLFEIWLNQTEIRLYLSFFDWFGTKQTSVWFQNNRKIVNTIWFRFNLIRFRKDFSVRKTQRKDLWSKHLPMSDILSVVKEDLLLRRIYLSVRINGESFRTTNFPYTENDTLELSYCYYRKLTQLFW